MDALKLAKGVEDLAIQMRQDLHQIPELELNLPETVAYVTGKLDEWGIPYKTLVDGNAVVALIQGKGQGPCLGIRADMDGLPIQEETGLSYASKHPGIMHACGHDQHTAVALATAKVLNDQAESFKGSVKMLFQPGEEIPGGAEPMIKEGALEDPKVDYVIGFHGGRLGEIEIGKLGFRPQELMASMDRFTITVQGKGGHGANPQETVDPIIISAEILLGIQKIISREISPLDSGLISVCKIDGGFTQNIIPNTVTMLGTARALNEDIRDTIEKRLEEISTGIAQTYGGDANLKYERMYPVLNNDPDLTGLVEEEARKLFPDDIIDLPRANMGGEDFACFAQEVPACFFFFCNTAPVGGVRYPNHHPKFNIEEKLLYRPIATFLATVDRLLGL